MDQEPKQTKQTSGKEQNHRNGDHTEGYQWGEGGGERGKVQRTSSINGR